MRGIPRILTMFDPVGSFGTARSRSCFRRTNSAHEQLLDRNVQWFRGGLVLKAQRLLYHSTLGLRVIKQKRKRRLSTPNPVPARKSETPGRAGQIHPIHPAHTQVVSPEFSRASAMQPSIHPSFSRAIQQPLFQPDTQPGQVRRHRPVAFLFQQGGRTGSWMGPPQGKRAPRVDPISIIYMRAPTPGSSQHPRAVRTVSGRARLGREHKSFM